MEAPVTPTPSQQGLEAAPAATVSHLTPAKQNVCLKEVANSAAEFFFNAVESVGRVLSRRVALLLTETMTEEPSTS